MSIQIGVVMSFRLFVSLLLLFGVICTGCASDEITPNNYCDREYKKYRKILSSQHSAMDIKLYEDVNEKIKEAFI